MSCENCTNCSDNHDEQQKAFVPFSNHQRDMARLSDANRRVWIALIISLMVIVLLIGCVMFLSVELNRARSEALESKNETIRAIQNLRDLENEIETVYEYDYDIQQDANDGGMNYLVGRDFYYGKAESENQDPENDTP